MYVSYEKCCDISLLNYYNKFNVFKGIMCHYVLCILLASTFPFNNESIYCWGVTPQTLASYFVFIIGSCFRGCIEQ